MRICRVTCHAQRAVACTRARVITFFLVFPWTVTFDWLRVQFQTSYKISPCEHFTELSMVVVYAKTNNTKLYLLVLIMVLREIQFMIIQNGPLQIINNMFFQQTLKHSCLLVMDNKIIIVSIYQISG